MKRRIGPAILFRSIVMNESVSATASRIDRRGWLASACALAAGGMLSRNVVTADEAPPTSGRFFDIHTHLGTVWNTTTLLTAEALLRWMDAHQVAKAAVLPLVSPESSTFPISTEYVLAQTRPFRDRLVPFCCIDPRASFQGGPKGLRKILQSYVEAGAKGFGEHKPGVKVDDPRSQHLYEACGELHLPILFHLDNQRNMDAPGLPGLESMLRKFPKTVFVGHAQGWWASISGDAGTAELALYPHAPVTPGGTVDRLMDKYPNIYGDLSAGSGANALSRDPKWAREFLIRRADRLLYGSDYLSPDQRVPQFEILEQMHLPADVRKKIDYANAARLLSLD
jgi:hypothetical protein